jgi:hypothetical protein
MAAIKEPGNVSDVAPAAKEGELSRSLSYYEEAVNVA